MPRCRRQSHGPRRTGPAAGRRPWPPASRRHRPWPVGAPECCGPVLLRPVQRSSHRFQCHRSTGSSLPRCRRWPRTSSGAGAYRRHCWPSLRCSNDPSRPSGNRSSRWAPRSGRCSRRRPGSSSPGCWLHPARPAHWHAGSGPPPGGHRRDAPDAPASACPSTGGSSPGNTARANQHGTRAGSHGRRQRPAPRRCPAWGAASGRSAWPARNSPGRSPPSWCRCSAPR